MIDASLPIFALRLSPELLHMRTGSKRLKYKRIDTSHVEELWLESNPIGSEGFESLSKYLKHPSCNLRILKFYENKKDISTSVSNQLVESIESNQTIVKFVFKFRFQHQKDKIAKSLRRNQEIARKKRLAEKKKRGN